jgi:hypothetical protein
MSEGQKACIKLYNENVESTGSRDYSPLPAPTTPHGIMSENLRAVYDYLTLLYDLALAVTEQGVIRNDAERLSDMMAQPTGNEYIASTFTALNATLAGIPTEIDTAIRKAYTEKSAKAVELLSVVNGLIDDLEMFDNNLQWLHNELMPVYEALCTEDGGDVVASVQKGVRERVEMYRKIRETLITVRALFLLPEVPPAVQPEAPPAVQPVPLAGLIT